MNSKLQIKQEPQEQRLEFTHIGVGSNTMWATACEISLIPWLRSRMGDY
jgi:hypothetical protein